MAIVKARRNNTVIAVTAHPKMNPGDIWINTEGYRPERIRLLSRPYWRPWCVVAGGAWAIDYEIISSPGSKCSTYLGDLGAPGVAYDDRPFRWVKSEWDVSQRVKETDAWYAMNPPDYIDRW